MIFRRRKPADRWERFRTFMWPRRSFSRSARYFSKRVLRLTATPHAIAAGVAAGSFASFTPYMGLHFLLAAGLAWALRGNLLASALGTAVGNPLTFPFIWAATYHVGNFILSGRQPSDIEPMQLGAVFRHLEFSQLWHPLLKPMTVGAIPVGVPVAVGLYFLTRWATAAFQEKRRARLAARATPKRIPAGAEGSHP
jgi:uncharacterized protein (DUF2062 family)